MTPKPNCPDCLGTGRKLSCHTLALCNCTQPAPENATGLGVERNDDGSNPSPAPQNTSAPLLTLPTLDSLEQYLQAEGWERIA